MVAKNKLASIKKLALNIKALYPYLVAKFLRKPKPVKSKAGLKPILKKN
jgi:hypothetical protein